MSADTRSRRELWWLAAVIGVTVLLAVGGVGVVLDRYHEADAERRAQRALAQLEHDIDAVRFFPASYLYGQPGSVSATAQERLLGDALIDHSIALDRLAPSAATRRIRAMAIDLAQRGNDVMGEVERRSGRATEMNDSILQPSATQLAALLPQVDKSLAAEAEDDKNRADATIVLTMLAVVLANALLALSYGRHRRFAARVATEREAQHASEARLEALLANSSDLIVVIDANLVVTYVSPAIELVLGISPEKFVGAHVEAFVHPDDIARLWASAPKHGDPMESRWRHADGSWRDVESVYTDMTADPAIRGYVNNVRDITARKELERELHRSQKLESVGQLASGIAHEINTPVQFVGDNLRFLDEAFRSVFALISEQRRLVNQGVSVEEVVEKFEEADAGTEISYFATEVPHALAEALEGVDRIASIVRAMRSVGHPDGADQTAVDINECLNDTLIVARNEIKHVANVVTDFGELPLVRCYRGDINQVFLNLLVNAAHAVADKHASDGQLGVITVCSRLDGDEVVVSIVDSGVGIPSEVRDRVFDHFFTTKEVGRGTGQGLALARALVIERHQGAITFESIPGEGTTFVVRLPIAGVTKSEEIAEVRA